jgi:hypothetical protein
MVFVQAFNLILCQPQTVQVLEVGKILKVREILDEILAEIEKLEELKVFDETWNSEKLVVVEVKVNQLH